MNKHTAGPWEYYREEQKVTDLHGECFSLFFHSVKSKGFKDGGNIVRVGNEYDARLIAAAPDMLDALITDYLVFKNYENIHNAKGNVEKAFSNKAQADRIRGIIESATGENIEEAK